MYFRGQRRNRDMAGLAMAVRLGRAKDADFKKQIKAWLED